MNIELMFSSETDLWETPKELFNRLNEIYHFELDVCATDENALCENYFTRKDNGLNQDWRGVCWMNPPYGREIGKWVEKAYKEAGHSYTVVVALLPARTDTKWFHDYINGKEGVTVEFLKGRLKFGGNGSKNSAPFPSMLVVFN